MTQQKIIVKIPAVPEKEVEKINYTCDICGRHYKHKGTRRCCLCGRDACDSYLTPCGGWDPNEIGDYPDWYCKVCLKLKFENYQKELDAIAEEQYIKEEALLQKIKEESLKTKL